MRRLIFAAIATVLIAGCGGPRTSMSPPPRPQPASATGSVHPKGWGSQGPAPTLGVGASSGTAVMFDAIEVAAIPASPFAAAGYTGGLWATDQPLRARWPDAHTISIAVEPWEHADCLDIEPLDAEPDEAVAWDEREARAGHEPCDYSDWYEWTHEIDPVLESADLRTAKIWKWDANFDGVPHIDPGFQATQYDNHCEHRNLDCSLVDRAFLSIAQPPLEEASRKLALLDALLGAHSRSDPRGHNCQHPPYRHAYPNASWDHACGVWAQEARALR